MDIQKQYNLIGNEKGYWFVSKNGRLWLPNGEVPNGSASELGFTNKLAQPIGGLD